MEQSQITTPEDARRFLVSFFESLEAPTLIQLAAYLQADPEGSADRLLAIAEQSARPRERRPHCDRGDRVS